MELIKEIITVEEAVCGERCSVGVDGSIIVPDVKPDILKILQVDATAVLAGKEISDDKIIFSGCVNLKILYVPDRADDSIQSIVTSFDFTHKAERRALTSEMYVNADVDVEHVDFRLINSRKLSVKAGVCIDMNVCRQKNIEVVTDIEADGSAELIKTPVCINSAVAGCERELVVKDSVEVPSGKVSIGEILKVDAKISDKDLKTVTGKAVVKGMVNTSILYTGNNGSAQFVELDLPFTEVFDVENITEGLDCEIDYFIKDSYYDVSEDNDGDKRIVNLEFVVGARIRASESVNINIVDDCYVPGCDTELTREEIMLDELVCHAKQQNTLRELAAADNGAPLIASVYHVITKASITKTSVEKDKTAVEGIVESYILYLSDNSENPIYSCKKEIPFCCMLECEGAQNGMECEALAEVEHTGYNLNMAGEVELRIILSVSTKIIKKRRISLITGAEVAEISDRSDRGIVIYFIQQGDSLWNIAKRYRVAVSDIAEYNGIEVGSELMVGNRLIIPA